MKLWQLIHLSFNTRKHRYFKSTCVVLLSLIFAIAFIHCQVKEEKVTVIKTINLALKPSYSNQVGLYYDKNKKTEALCFFSSKDEKKLKLFNLDGVLIDSIPLEEATKVLDNVGNISILSLDTIIINSNYTNQLAVINRTGKVWKQLNLEDRLIDTESNCYDFASPFYAVEQKANTALFSAYWRENRREKITDTVPRDLLGHSIYFNRHVQNAPFFVSINQLFSDSAIVKFHYPGFYKTISQEVCLLAEISNFTIIGNSIYVHSFYSNNLYKLNRLTYQLEKTIPLKSKFTTIGTHFIKLNTETIPLLQDSITYKGKTSGQIEKLIFDKNTNRYYVVVRHSSTPEAFDKNRVGFSILVLNEQLEQVNEYAFTDFKYRSYGTILCSKGLLLFHNDTSKLLIKNETIRYSLFRLP